LLATICKDHSII